MLIIHLSLMIPTLLFSKALRIKGRVVSAVTLGKVLVMRLQYLMWEVVVMHHQWMITQRGLQFLITQILLMTKQP